MNSEQLKAIESLLEYSKTLDAVDIEDITGIITKSIQKIPAGTKCSVKKRVLVSVCDAIRPAGTKCSVKKRVLVSVCDAIRAVSKSLTCE